MKTKKKKTKKLKSSSSKKSKNKIDLRAAGEKFWNSPAGISIKASAKAIILLSVYGFILYAFSKYAKAELDLLVLNTIPLPYE